MSLPPFHYHRRSGYLQSFLHTLFLAFPVLFYLMVSTDSVIYKFSYLLPSRAAFYGLMDLYSGQVERLWLNIAILAAYTVILNFVFICFSQYRTKKIYQV